MSIKTEKTLTFGCLHVPYQDRKAHAALLDFVKTVKPQRIIINGDNNDLYTVSKYFKNPARQQDLQYEVDEGVIANLALRRAAGKDCEIIMNFGNHEFRWEKYLQENAKEIAGLKALEFEELFGLNKAGIVANRGRGGKYARYNLGGVSIGHFEVALKHSASTEKSLVDSRGCSVIASHSHRKGRFFKTLASGMVLEGIGTGCLCDVDQQDYAEDPNWQLGWVLTEKVEGKSRYFHHDIPVVGGNVLFNGKLY